MIYGITYTDDRMTQSAALCCLSMQRNGVERAFQYGKEQIDKGFYELNKDIFTQGRGCGYWLWKPYFISKIISEYCNDGDILIYSDAGVEWLQSVHEIISRMDQDIFFFTNGFPHVEWCKGDALRDILKWDVDINSPDNEDGLLAQQQHFNWLKNEYKQVQASVIFLKVNQNTRNFVKEWLLWCQMPGFIDDSQSKLPNYPTFAEHRHDQAILTCLQIKYGYKLHFWPTAYSEHIRHTAQPEDNYPTMFNHHRKRDPGKGDGQPEWPQS